MKKIKKHSLLIGLITIPFFSAFSISSCSNSNKTKNDFSNISRDQIINDDFFSIGTNTSKLISTNKRNVQKNYYNSEAFAKYGKEYNFQYPSQERNYKNQNNNIFKNKNNQTIDGFDVVFNERVTDTDGNYVLINNEKIKYNDARWIKSEIESGTFKKHKAADKMFLNDISTINSVTKEYTISTATLGELALGLFAPAGEIIEISFDDKTWNLLKDNLNTLDFVINQNFWDNRDKNDSGRISNRYPFIETHFNLDKNSKTIKIGTPFGGGISLDIKNNLIKNNSFPIDSQVQDIKFTIKGAIPCLFYQDGITTEKEWFDQINKVTQEKLAPILQATSAYFSLTIPFTGFNEVGHRPVKDLKYPKNSFKKWNDFLYLSNYFAGRDLSKFVKRLNMEFCDDIWGDAAAWGGGMNFYCPTEWGVNSIFYKDPEEVFNAANSWGVFHEINHNFQQNLAFFNKRTHPETNQVTAFGLGMISDITRFRNEINWTGEFTTTNSESWARLDTPFSIISILERWTGTHEYEIYSLLLFFMGYKNFLDYVRKDVIEHPSDAPGWTGLKEIERISDTFKLNLWPAFEDYGRYWRDTWPESYVSANLEERQIIDRLNSSYKAMDFVANQYACGSYLYNESSKEYDYTGDLFPAFEIPAFTSYTFKFDEMIKSINKKFDWNEIKFDAKTKTGATLEKDPTNKKRLIYKPNINKLSEIDEFDISIIPSQWNGKPNNYVSEYKFKIKIRQIINEPTLETFNVLSNNNYENSFKELNSLSNFDYRIAIGSFNNVLFQDNQRRGIKIKFKFVAPKDGEYVFSSIWDDWYKLKINGKDQYLGKSYNNQLKEVYRIRLSKGQSIDFENQIINTGGLGKFDLEVKLDGNKLNIFENVLLPNIGDYIEDNKKYYDLVNDKNYKYNVRYIDRKIYNMSLTSAINLSTYSQSTLEPNNDYYLTSKYGDAVKQLNTYDGIFELWNSDHAPSQAASEFEINFNNYTYVNSLFFGHRTDNWHEGRPTNIKVIGYDENNINERILYEGKYGLEFNDRSHNTSILNLTNPSKVKKIKVEMFNTKLNCLVLKWVRVSSNKYTPYGPSFGFNNPAIHVDNGWQFKINNELNSSALNNSYIQSQGINNKISFTINKTNGFVIVGQTNEIPSIFDVYINGKLHKTVNTYSEKIVNNAALLDVHYNNSTTLKVDIISKSNNNLFLNYIMTFGKDTFIS